IGAHNDGRGGGRERSRDRVNKGIDCLHPPLLLPSRILRLAIHQIRDNVKHANICHCVLPKSDRSPSRPRSRQHRSGHRPWRRTRYLRLRPPVRQSGIYELPRLRTPRRHSYRGLSHPAPLSLSLSYRRLYPLLCQWSSDLYIIPYSPLGFYPASPFPLTLYPSYPLSSLHPSPFVFYVSFRPLWQRLSGLSSAMSLATSSASASRIEYLALVYILSASFRLAFSVIPLVAPTLLCCANQVIGPGVLCLLRRSCVVRLRPLTHNQVIADIIDDRPNGPGNTSIRFGTFYPPSCSPFAHTEHSENISDCIICRSSTSTITSMDAEETLRDIPARCDITLETLEHKLSI
ncbi:hypothetical protein BD311DRAFT_816487, partial [Dichomitus squalens]